MKRWFGGALWLFLLLTGVAMAQDKMIIFYKDGRTQSIDLESIQKVEYQLRPGTSTMPLKNIALRKPVRQSSTGWGGNPSRAVDGNRDGNYGAGSITHTNNAPQEWWEVDMETVHFISEIKLWNRTDCCPERLSNFYVFVSSQPFSSGNINDPLGNRAVWRYHFPGTAGRETTIPVNSDGRYVRIQLAGQNWLSLAEVEVFGR